MEILDESILGIPVPLILVAVILVLVVCVPLAQWIDYRRNCKKYGKEEADEIRRRY